MDHSEIGVRMAVKGRAATVAAGAN
ncbi:hypothetical protein CBM2634_U10020 [Cupriavidus taiwanensis]|uniref:Uncharacterized protein n=1 Tax=Cupriavidus taiwanensis TaxID=164546 RepID=A0A375JBZ1_9BURK|nr:hypothetical protein CBM2634_U10020 [Cupriavidus taiwanensis]